MLSVAASISLLVGFELRYSVLANPLQTKPKSTQLQTAVKANSERPTLKLYKGIFPYENCLLITINQVFKKPHNALLLKATIEDVYRGNYLRKSPLTVSFFDGSDPQYSYASILALRNTRQIIAFNRWPNDESYFDFLKPVPPNLICNLWIPYAKKGFQSCDIAQIKALIKDSPTQAERARVAFQRLLETKWTPERINDFCRPENQWPVGGATEHTANYPDDWLSIPMHSNKTAELQGKKVTWQASVHNNVPTYYNIIVDSQGSDKKCWNLEAASPSLEEWTDDDFLKHRITQSISQSVYAEFMLNFKTHREAATYHGLFNNRSKEKLLKDETGEVTAYQCHLDNGKTMTAVLSHDRIQSIDKILINDKLDRAWTDMYKSSKANHDKCRDNACKPKH